MPMTSGIDAAREIEKPSVDAGGRPVPIIGTSAFMRPGRQPACREAGPLLTFSQPMDHDRLCRTVATLLGGLPKGPEV